MNRRKLVAAILAAAFIQPVMAGDADPRVDEAKGIIKEFFSTLKGELQAGMKAGGPVNAIGVCNQKAPDIAASTSAKSGWKVARTSLKIRNGDNAPDAWEQQVLESFEQRHAAGENPVGIDFAETVQQDGKTVFRYMKAIPMSDVCLKCHGDKLDPKVEAKLNELYPDDRARGFHLSDIRGAFTLQKVE